MEKNELFRLILSIIICQMAGIIGSIFTAGSVTSWYPTLVKPSFFSTGILYRINLDRSLHPNGPLTLPYLEGDSQQSSG